MSRLVSDKYKAEEEKELQNGGCKQKSDISKTGTKIAVAIGIVLIIAIIIVLIFI